MVRIYGVPFRMYEIVVSNAFVGLVVIGVLMQLKQTLSSSSGIWKHTTTGFT
jgi:hypothetical protein